MIQEIGPRRLLNAFRPERAPGRDDFAVCVRGDEILLTGGEGEAAFPRMGDFREVPACVYLFSVDGRGYYLVLSEADRSAETGGSYYTLRAMRYGLKGPRATMYAAYTAWHLASWYRDSRYCGRCGHSTRHHETERAMRCPACGNVIYPRLVPAVIVGVTHGDEILMTKYANRAMPFYALVAGFTEIGETLEECVVREVREETGLAVGNIRYYKSQPWGSVQDILMGFFCDVEGASDIRLDRTELKEGIWVRREDIHGQLDDWSLTHDMMMAFKEGREPRGCR